MFYQVRGPVPDEPNVDSFERHRVVLSQLNPDEILRIRDVTRDLEDSGFAQPVAYLIAPSPDSRLVVAAWRHTSGETIARALLYPVTPTSGPESVIFVSAFEGDSFLISAAAPFAESAPANVRLHRFLGASIETLWDSHRRKLALETTRQAVAIQSSPDV